MNNAEIKQNIEKELKGVITGCALIGQRRMMIFIKPENLLDVARYLFLYLKCRFITASAVYTKKGFELYYHFSFDTNGLIINVRTMLPEKQAGIESLANMIEAANWIEREIHELYGINFLNHPNLVKLISEGNWEEGVYPYADNNNRFK